MKNFLSLLVAALALNIAISSLALPNLVNSETVYAAPATEETTSNLNDKNPLKDMQFNVSKNLKVDGQEKKYFKPGSTYPPIIAFIITVLEFATQIIGSLAVLIMIIGGFMFMTAQGDQTQIDKAKDVIKYAIIGLVVTFLSYIIVIFLQSLFITSEQTV